jgi:hypothetical protein
MLFTSAYFICTAIVAEVLVAITSSVKETCKKTPTERVFLEKYGRVCLCLDEIILQVIQDIHNFKMRASVLFFPAISHLGFEFIWVSTGEFGTDR